MLDVRAPGICSGGILDHGIDISNSGILWCSQPFNGADSYTGNPPLSRLPECHQDANLFEGSSFSDGVVDLGQELEDAAVSREFDANIDSINFRWIDSHGDLAKERT